MSSNILFIFSLLYVCMYMTSKYQQNAILLEYFCEDFSENKN